MSSKNIHKRHGENIKRMERIPETPNPKAPPDIKIVSQGNMPPAEIKRLTKKTTNRQTKNTPRKTQT